MAVTWDPSISYSAAGFSFETSADGLTAWMTGGGSGYFLFANKTMAPNSGKYYWEMVWFGSIAECGMAIPGTSSEAFGGNYRYREFDPTTPQIRYRNPATSNTGGVNLDASMNASAGNVMMFAYDTANGHFWYGLNGTWYNSGDPASDTNFTVFANNSGYSYQPMALFDTEGQTSQSVQLNTITTSYTPPTGFSTLDLPPPEVALPTFSYSLNVLGTERGLFNDQYALNAKELRKGLLVDRWSQAADPVWTPVVTAIHYRLTLRDTGFTDLELPMSSFQSRVRQGRPSFLEVYVPGILGYLDDINDRIDGELVVEMGTRKTDGTISVIEIARGNLQAVRYDRGPISSTGTLTGRKTKTYTGSKTVQIDDVALVSNTSTNRIRCKVLNEVQPGDTVEAAGISFVVDLIQHIVSPQQAYMELSDG